MLHRRLPSFFSLRNRAFFGSAVCALAALASPPGLAGPKYPGTFTDDGRLDAIAEAVGVAAVPIAEACADPDPAGGCRRQALDRTRRRLARGAPLRVLHLGDSHVAADYITSMIRRRLQAKHGAGGRGFVHVEQRWGFGGRKVGRKGAWTRTRVVDRGGPGKPFGFSGMSLVSDRAGARIGYRLLPEDRRLRIYYHQTPRGAPVEVRVAGEAVATFDTRGPEQSRVFDVELPALEGPPPKRRRGPAGWTLRLVAKGAGAQLFGLSFEAADAKGIVYDSVGPVGADAKVYLDTGRDSFVEHLRAHDPNLVVLMVGGNDALKIRKGWTTLERVRADHAALIDLLRQTLPEADVLLWAPMDAGRREGRRIVPKRFVAEVRDMQRAVAQAKGIAFWDTLAAMGGPGAVRRWARADLMASDLVHPKKPGADLLGRLFAEAFEAL